MDRRLLLAIGLMLIVAVLPSILWPPKPPPAATGAEADSTVVATEQAPVSPGGPQEAAPTPGRQPAVEPPEVPPTTPAAGPAPQRGPERLVVVESDLYRYAFSSRGARLVQADLKEYRSFKAGDSTAAQLIPDPSEFLAYRFVAGRDTLDLADWVFEPDRQRIRLRDQESSLRWTARRDGREVALTYRFSPDTYRFAVSGTLVGFDTGLLLIGLGPRLRSIDADTAADIQAYGVVTESRGTERLNFRSLDPFERQELSGPFDWVAIKSKYFVAAVFALSEGQPLFGGVEAVGGARTGRLATEVHTTVSLPVPAASFTHDVYIGPQEFRRLRRIGHDFEDVNPYGWILRPIIRPFVNYIILPVLLWMHESLNLAYGWVLILFGIAVRILLWPLNQKAMQSSTAMQAIQPEMKALQEKYKQEPQKLQQEMMKLYKEHGVNPLGGCFPMLLPMPVLFALFFVFANTIEFRGVSFLWLPDLSRADPFYVIPLIMGASMFAVSKLGQRGVPPNPQAKMMTYIMPPMFTFLFLRFSAGLNLYYAVSNIASIPQQWMISNERIKRLGDRSKGKSG